MEEVDRKPLTVLTVNTDGGIGERNWELTLQNHGFGDTVYEILGKGQAWKGFDWRSRKYLARLKQLRAQYGPRHIVLTTDCLDVLFIRSQQDLLRTFHAIKANVVISADHMQMVGDFSNSTSRSMAANILKKRLGASEENLWVNAGLIMGYVDGMIRLYTSMLPYEDDQEGLQMAYLADPSLGMLDCRQQLFGTLESLQHLTRGFFGLDASKKSNSTIACLDLEHASGFVQHRTTRTFPCVLHFPCKRALVYNEFLEAWKESQQQSTQRMQRQGYGHAVWMHDLQPLTARPLSGWCLPLYIKSAVGAHKREVSIVLVLAAAFVLALLLRKCIVRARQSPLSSMSSLSSSLGPSIQ
jgi:hypothetical protein